MELQHFFHSHPLTFLHYWAYSNFKYPCDGCCEEILGFSYGCKSCEFFLHKSCGEQPRELQHPLHPQHPLILHIKKRLTRGRCYFCNKYIRGGFAYHCLHCNFNLHLKCASIPFTVEAEFHDHPLKLLRKSISFTCDACGKKDEDMYSYLCTNTLTCMLTHGPPKMCCLTIDCQTYKSPARSQTYWLFSTKSILPSSLSSLR
jgi:hypothetical protein